MLQIITLKQINTEVSDYWYFRVKLNSNRFGHIIFPEKANRYAAV